MGVVNKVLAETFIPDRDAHNCRVFIDLAESVHLHYREHRIVFTVEEYFEVAKAFNDGAKKLKERVEKGYKVDGNHNTEIIGGSQIKSIKVLNPHKSYFNNRLVVEKQADSVMDKIHIHYRDYRLVMNNMETFNKVCKCLEQARKNLELMK